MLAVAALAVAGCAGASDDGSSEPAAVGLTPTFPALPPTTAPGPTTSSDDAAGDTTTTAPVSVEVEPPTTTPPVIVDPAAPPPSATITDPEGDLTPSVLPPPAWADLVGGRLIRHADGFELRVALGGGAAPSSSGDPDQTMNVASFYDVDGDGSIDFEVWANLADGGWGGSWFDNRSGTAAFADEAAVAITVERAEVVLRFPLTHVGEATVFRWSLASEWGRYETIGTELAARDDAPDDDQPADFPG